MDAQNFTWKDVHDPTGRVKIRADLSMLSKHFNSMQLQGLINEYDIEYMVEFVNTLYARKENISPLVIWRDDKQYVLTSAMITDK